MCIRDRREAALEKILPEQQGDFEKLYEALEGNPVTIRFLDPPLHEFVPTEEEDIKKLADAQGKTVEQIKTIIDSLHAVSYTHLGEGGRADGPSESGWFPGGQRPQNHWGWVL